LNPHGFYPTSPSREFATFAHVWLRLLTREVWGFPPLDVSLDRLSLARVGSSRGSKEAVCRGLDLFMEVEGREGFGEGVG
jgi:hypothetical protein